MTFVLRGGQQFSATAKNAAFLDRQRAIGEGTLQMAVLLDGDAVAMTLPCTLPSIISSRQLTLPSTAFTHYLNQMLFGLNVAGDLTVDIDMAAGDYIADEMHPLAMTVVSCFCWRPLRVLG